MKKLFCFLHHIVHSLILFLSPFFVRDDFVVYNEFGSHIMHQCFIQRELYTKSKSNCERRNKM